MPSSTVRASLVIIAIVVAGAALFWLRGILAPLVLAIFLLIMIDGLARGVRRAAPFISASAALPAAMALIVLAFVGAVTVVINGFANFASQSAQLHNRLNALIADTTHAMHLKAELNIDKFLGMLDQPANLSNAAATVQAVASDALFVLIYLGFLMASRAGFQRKAEALFTKAEGRREARVIGARIRDGVEIYVWTQTMTGLMIAVPALALMLLLGLKNALFWAFVIFLFNFVPIIGGLIAVGGPALFALVQFPGYWQALVLAGTLESILLVVGTIVLPRMQAKTQNIDPVVVLLSFAFWGALWGTTGAFLSTPLTVIAIALLSEFEGSRWIAVLMSGDGRPYPDAPTLSPETAAPEPAFAGASQKIASQKKRAP
jgi:predicted PurR-regulated permease PerM